MIDGEIFRVVNESGKVFQPNDIKSVEHHLNLLAKGGGKGCVGKGKNTAMMALPAPDEGNSRRRGRRMVPIDMPTDSRREGLHSKRGKAKSSGVLNPPVKKSFLKNEVRRRRNMRDRDLSPETAEAKK